MSLLGNSGRQSWRDFLDTHDDRDMTIERAHELARDFLAREGLNPSAYNVDVSGNQRGREGRIKVSITPIAVLPSFGAEWDNNWNRS